MIVKYTLVEKCYKRIIVRDKKVVELENVIRE